jgi:2-C-methyl-D-erythritol 4-phosphate cytidylyltransferase
VCIALTMERSVIIVAGGKGVRMGCDIPKQFLLIGGKPILMHTIEKFYRTDKSLHIVVVLPHDQQAYWQVLCAQFHFDIEHSVVDGGSTRFESVRNGLTKTGKVGLIGVHDGVRPFVSEEVIRRCYQKAAERKAVVPVVAIAESVRQVSADGNSHAVRRDEYKLVQTPQVFDAALLHRAYEQPYSPAFTDDASVVEAMGTKIYLTKGNVENMKITTPFDRNIANMLTE